MIADRLLCGSRYLVCYAFGVQYCKLQASFVSRNAFRSKNIHSSPMIHDQDLDQMTKPSSVRLTCTSHNNSDFIYHIHSNLHVLSSLPPGLAPFCSAFSSLCLPPSWPRLFTPPLFSFLSFVSSGRHGSLPSNSQQIHLQWLLKRSFFVIHLTEARFSGVAAFPHSNE